MVLPFYLLRATRPPTHAALAAGKPKIKVESYGFIAHYGTIIARRKGVVKRETKLKVTL
jgi:hypothetical protein